MSIFKVNSDDLEHFTIVTNPYRQYVSSSTQGSTGSVYVFARRSNREKESAPLSSFVESTHNDVDLNTTLSNLQSYGQLAQVSGSSSTVVSAAKSSFTYMLNDYLTKINSQSISARKNKALEIIRFTPTVNFTSNTMRKLIVKNQLSSYYRTDYPSAHWAYNNYNCLNFFTSSTVPTSSCLIYPNVDGGQSHVGYISGTYTPSGSISFDFYINPCYRADSIDGQFRAGTIFHLSSTYALSLISGSSKDENGKSLGYRLQLQFSHSADIAPSLLRPSGNNGATTSNTAAYRSDLVFLSDDNALKYNNWHHVVVRWGTNLTNDGTGSFNVDGIDKGLFVIPSGTITPLLFPAAGYSSPDVLCVGNYFNGLNFGTGSTSYFFAADPALRDGLTALNATAGVNEPTAGRYTFDHPLNAQVHDLAIKRYYMSNDDIILSASMGPNYIDPDWTAFYCPPFFVQDSPYRQYVNDSGGILQTPFFEINGTTDDPFNTALSFGVDGHYINIENFVRDFASDVFPRVHHMTGVAITTTTTLKSANDFLYEQPFVVRRNTLIMPCDDGLFVPSYSLLASESLRTSAKDDLGIEDLSYINLDNMILTSSLLFANDFSGSNAFANESIGYTPEQPGLTAGRAILAHRARVYAAISSGTLDAGIQQGAPLTIYQRTRDTSSNQVTFFDISNLYYGKRILPGSVVLKDTAFTSSGGALQFTLKDDGRGTLYKANCYTSASTWNSVGTVFYDEGIIVIKNPHLYFFGKNGFEISFKGEQNIHVLTIDTIAPSNQLNSSSNRNYKSVPASGNPNDSEQDYVYITGINYHDENLNVIMKTQLAQPVVKRYGDKYLFKTKLDF